jgi:signal transduction histidine kinase
MRKAANPPRPFLRTSMRLSLQFSLLYAVLSGAAFVMAYWFTDYEVREWVVEQMEYDAQSLAQVYNERGAQGLVDGIALLSEVNFETARIYQLVDEGGQVVVGNVVGFLAENGPWFLPVEEVELTSPIEDEIDGYWLRSDQIGPFTLIQGTGNHIVAEVLEALSVALVLGYLALLGLGLWAGARVGRFTEHKINAISDTLSLVSDGNLDARIKIEGSGKDDLARVSAGINATLEQIKRLLESQEQISNDIAHDLRTPLQRLRQRLEKISQDQTVDPADIAACLHQTEDVIATFNALLRIAQIEAGNRQERFADLDINTLLANVVDVYEPSAEDNGQSLILNTCAHCPEVTGDKSLLTQLFSNLVENTLVHCPTGTTTTLDVSQVDGDVVVSVSDTGPGIAAKDRNRVFDRFFRSEQSRSSAGNGLGLSLAKAIVEMHGGTITVENATGGTTVRVRL